MAEKKRWGSKVRRIRREAGFTQTALARSLGISVSYLNMIEHDRRSLSAPLLVELARVLEVDLASFGPDDEQQLLHDLMEVFGDPLFDHADVLNVEVRELVEGNPGVARAVLSLYRAFRDSRERVQNLAEHLAEEDVDGDSMTHAAEPPEEVAELIQRHANYFPELEAGARALVEDAALDPTDMFQGLADYLAGVHGVRTEIRKVGEMGGAIRRFDRSKGILELSEVLRRGSRNFQLAYVVGLLTQDQVLDRFARDPQLRHPGSRALCRAALGNYFAAAILMPYDAFLTAAQDLRYDIELLGHRFRTSVEQVCHRLTTLRQPGAEGVPFHVVRTDIAGNISKSFSATAMHFARFSGACPRWQVFRAFLTPGRFRVGLSRMPDGTAFFELAFTVQRESRGYRAPQPIQAIGIGCALEHAKKLVYSDGIDLENLESAQQIGMGCRLCDRMECEERAFPPIQYPMRIDEYVRGVSFYTPVTESGTEPS